MTKRIQLKITNNQGIYKELAEFLIPYKNKPVGSCLFIVEGTVDKPIIGLRYPGKKLRRRKVGKTGIPWANLLDFEVVIFDKGGNEITSDNFTFSKMLEDFNQHKKDSDEFWLMVVEVFNENTITKKPPKLGGIDTLLFLYALKWIWIQEDLNYRLSWKDVASPEKYILETRTGKRTSKGAGRAKFFAAMILLREYDFFDFETVKKIIPPY